METSAPPSTEGSPVEILHIAHGRLFLEVMLLVSYLSRSREATRCPKVDQRALRAASCRGFGGSGGRFAMPRCPPAGPCARREHPGRYRLNTILFRHRLVPGAGEVPRGRRLRAPRAPHQPGLGWEKEEVQTESCCRRWLHRFGFVRCFWAWRCGLQNDNLLSKRKGCWGVRRVLRNLSSRGRTPKAPAGSGARAPRRRGRREPA